MSDKAKAAISATILLGIALVGFVLLIQWSQEKSVDDARECIESGGEWLQTSTYSFVCRGGR